LVIYDRLIYYLILTINSGNSKLLKEIKYRLFTKSLIEMTLFHIPYSIL